MAHLATWRGAGPDPEAVRKARRTATARQSLPPFPLPGRLFGPMTDLQQQQYLTDPRLRPRARAGAGRCVLFSKHRKLIADFYMAGDARGPRGSLKLHQLAPGASTLTSQAERQNFHLQCPGQMPRLTARAPGLPPSSALSEPSRARVPQFQRSCA